MNIYAIKDRLIDYYLQPFAAPDDKSVMASISNLVSNTENMDAIAQAPHHFEIWRLAHVTQDGHIEENREFIADCSSLVRRSVRGREQSGGDQDHSPVKRSTDAPERTSGNAAGTHSLGANAASAKPLAD